VVLYSIYSDNLTFEIIDYFKEHSIVFDGVYCPLQLDQCDDKSQIIRNSSNYNQIYFDFGVVDLLEPSTLPKIDIDS
jgi:hypothetical protein